MSRGLDSLHSEYLYRVLRPDEDPNSKLVCRDPSSTRTIDEHVESGLRFPSRFISTTSDFDAAHRWLNTANRKTSMRYLNTRKNIVKIDVELLKTYYQMIAASAYDLSNSLNREVFLKNPKQKKFSESYHEVVFVDEIPSNVVSIIYINGVGFVRNRVSTNTESQILSPPKTPIELPSRMLNAFSLNNIDISKRINSAKEPNSRISLAGSTTHLTLDKQLSEISRLHKSNSTHVEPKIIRSISTYLNPIKQAVPSSNLLKNNSDLSTNSRQIYYPPSYHTTTNSTSKVVKQFIPTKISSLANKPCSKENSAPASSSCFQSEYLKNYITEKFPENANYVIPKPKSISNLSGDADRDNLQEKSRQLILDMKRLEVSIENSLKQLSRLEGSFSQSSYK